MSEDFQLWLAKEKARQAEASNKDILEASNRTKTRASALLGWCVTLASASVAATFQSKEYKIEAGFAAIGFFASVATCVRALYSSPYSPLALSPDMFDEMLGQYPCTTELEVQNAFAEFASDVINTNADSVERDQRWLRRAWWIAGLTPVAAAGSFFLLRAINWLSFAHPR